MVIRAYSWIHIFGRSTPGLMFFGIPGSETKWGILENGQKMRLPMLRHMDPVFVWIIRATLVTVHFVMHPPL
jgi:hypothetical protein